MTDVIPNVFFILTEQSVILRFRIEHHLFRNKLRSLVFRFFKLEFFDSRNEKSSRKNLSDWKYVRWTADVMRYFVRRRSSYR